MQNILSFTEGMPIMVTQDDDGDMFIFVGVAPVVACVTIYDSGKSAIDQQLRENYRCVEEVSVRQKRQDGRTDGRVYKGHTYVPLDCESHGGELP